VYLEAQVQNITTGPICLEKVSLESSHLFNGKNDISMSHYIIIIALYVLALVARCGLMLAFEGSSQRSLSFGW